MQNSKAQMQQDLILDRDFFKGKTNGVFVEVGALDGVQGSNTYFFEKERMWKGLLIEPNPIEFKKIQSSDRQCEIENCAISNIEGEVNFLNITGPCNVLSGIMEFYNPSHLQRIERELGMYSQYSEGHEYYSTREVIKIKSQKLQSLIDKYNLNQIDLLSIDVEGSELQVLESIDFEKTNISCILLENNYGIEKETQFLAEKGFRVLGNIQWDVVFIKN
jgi:FkbM family methyltransferase